MSPDTRDPRWYEEFFDQGYLRAYRTLLASFDEKAEADFLIRELGLERGMKLLDLCCGQGRHSVELARRGLQVTGLDLSASLLAEAEKRAREAGVEVPLVRRDMREIPWTAEFDAAIDLFTAFGYFEEEAENLRVLEGAARSLRPGGRFALDVINFVWVLRHFEDKGWMTGEGGLLMLEDRRMDWARGIHESEHILIEADGRRRTVTTRLRLYLPHELVGLLRRAGLETERIYGDLKGSPFGLDSPRIAIIARKPG